MRTAVTAPPVHGRSVRPTRAEIDVDAIGHNVRVLRQRVAPAGLIAVVKADGYGHGAVPVARAAVQAGADWLAVALVEEAEELRAAGITAPVLLLSEPPPWAAGRVLDARVTATIYSLPFGEALRQEARRRGRRVRVHVKVDTGMARVGVPAQQWHEVLAAIASWPQLEVEAFWTHLACADTPGEASVHAQLEVFDAFLQQSRVVGLRPVFAHAANSAAALTLETSVLDAVRVGIAMYGCPPSAALAEVTRDAGLRPALRLVTEAAYVKRIDAGTPVSYGHTWRAPTAGWLVTLPIGYADGLPRHLSNRAEVILSGRRRPLVGTVCMDQVLVWCGDDEVAPGDEVVLIGRQGGTEVSALEWAEWAGTITYEIVSRLGPRIPRVYRGPGGQER